MPIESKTYKALFLFEASMFLKNLIIFLSIQKLREFCFNNLTLEKLAIEKLNFICNSKKKVIDYFFSVYF